MLRIRLQPVTVEYRRPVLLPANAAFTRTTAFIAVGISHHVPSYLVAPATVIAGVL